MNESDAISINKSLSKTIYFIIKRIFDIICALIGCVLMIPILIIVKISYMLTGDFNPMIYSHTRIGKNGKEFRLYKFRSMVWNADEVLKELLKDKKYQKEWHKNHKLSNDPRITKIGNIIRKTSLDEMPQFVNVLLGDMSMIGPRPLVKGELDEHNGDHAIYESVRPGITGWWACNGRSATEYKKRLELEYYYCKNCSILLDIKCIFRTIVIVLSRTGAQ